MSWQETSNARIQESLDWWASQELPNGEQKREWIRDLVPWKVRNFLFLHCALNGFTGAFTIDFEGMRNVCK